MTYSDLVVKIETTFPDQVDYNVQVSTRRKGGGKYKRTDWEVYVWGRAGTFHAEGISARDVWEKILHELVPCPHADLGQVNAHKVTA
jgi:hypothetical protein